jgi:hypothetical protein
MNFARDSFKSSSSVDSKTKKPLATKKYQTSALSHESRPPSVLKTRKVGPSNPVLADPVQSLDETIRKAHLRFIFDDEWRGYYDSYGSKLLAREIEYVKGESDESITNNPKLRPYVIAELGLPFKPIEGQKSTAQASSLFFPSHDFTNVSWTPPESPRSILATERPYQSFHVKDQPRSSKATLHELPSLPKQDDAELFVWDSSVFPSFAPNTKPPNPFAGKHPFTADKRPLCRVASIRESFGTWLDVRNSTFWSWKAR